MFQKPDHGKIVSNSVIDDQKMTVNDLFATIFKGGE